MYDEYFKLKEMPFTLSPDPSFLYLSKSHRMALTMLEYGLTSRATISVITGEVGCGKTTLLRRLLKDIPDDYVVGMITHTHASFRELLQWVAAAFGLEIGKKTGIALYHAFIEYLNEQHAAGRRVVLIIDEAQNLSANALEGIRMLSNINVDKDFILQLILVGQPELLDTMRKPELRQLAQRVSVDYHLRPLSQEETRRYIRHRLSVAGGDPELFDDGACDAVFHFSGGIPRLINTLCDMTMVYAYAEERDHIDRDLVVSVVRDRQDGGILPIQNGIDELPNPGLSEAVKEQFGSANPGAANGTNGNDNPEFTDPGGKIIDYPRRRES